MKTPNWSDPAWIKAELQQKWAKGLILRHAATGDDFFPLQMKLRSPASNEIGLRLSEIMPWVAKLKSGAKPSAGYGYELVEKVVQPHLSGKNTIPTHVVIPTLTDAIKLLGKQTQLQLFLQIAAQLTSKWPALQAWVEAYPLKTLAIGSSCEQMLAVLDCFFVRDTTQRPYLRQLDIPGVDTKFIETNKTILSELLECILPDDKMQQGTHTFEEKFLIRRKPSFVRFRLLDPNFTTDKFTDMTVPLEEFIQWNPAIKRFFFTENEINFLSFPPVPNACVIFGKGYGVDLLRPALWLREKEIFYWGDIDTHGFNILAMARQFLPQIKSFLMSEEVLLAHRPLWVSEAKPFAARIEHLTPQEYALVCNLQYDKWGKGVRLEQERIGFSHVDSFLQTL